LYDAAQPMKRIEKKNSANNKVFIEHLLFDLNIRLFYRTIVIECRPNCRDYYQTTRRGIKMNVMSKRPWEY
jgi:hypothetical protein